MLALKSKIIFNLLQRLTTLLSQQYEKKLELIDKNCKITKIVGPLLGANVAKIGKSNTCNLATEEVVNDRNSSNWQRFY